MTFLEQLEQTPPAAKMILPAAILYLVKRDKHPVIWWFFGVFPMASAVAQAITERRLIGPKAPASSAPAATAFVVPEFPGQRLPGTPDFVNPDGSPGYYIR